MTSTDPARDHAPHGDRAAALERVAQLLDGADTAMLTTVDADGDLAARPMALVPRAFDGRLHLFTDEASHEAADIAARPRVGVTVDLSARGDWIALAGEARIVRDDAQARALWDDRLNPWFVDGPDTAGIVLVQVELSRAEYWEGPGAAQTLFGSLRAALTRSADDPLLDVEHAAIDL